jgi:hypothetical protein
MPYEELPTWIEYIIDFIADHKFATGIIVGLFLYQPIFYVLFGIKVIIFILRGSL